MRSSWDAERDPLAALRDGDEGPFEAFVETEARTLLGFFLRLGAPRAEAEDLTQEVFLRLFRHAPDYEPRDRFTALTFRVARNAWIDRQRRVRAVGLADAEQDEDAVAAPPTPAPGPQEQAESREEAQRLRTALASLPEHHRLVFELGVLQELPYLEIADLLDIPEGTVKSRMFHAVRKLRAVLEPRSSERRDRAAPETEEHDR